MAQHTLTFDVSAEVGTGEALTQAAWLFLPEDPSAATAVLLCLAGGTYDKRYWHLEVPGRRGYSFAEHLAGQGYIVVALDHLGVGGSSDPERSGDVGLPLLAAGDAAVAVQLRARMRAGALVPGLPSLDLPLVGVGHSMGACLTTMMQAQERPYDAVVLLGYGVQISNVHEAAIDAEDLHARITQSLAAFRERTGTAPDAVSTIVPRQRLRQLFHAPDVPDDVIAADDAAESRVPVLAASEVTTPGYVQRYAAVVDVPVFVALGAVLDVSPDPYAELAGYRASQDVTLHLVAGSAHCHNFAGNRVVLWDHIAAWVPRVTARAAAPVAAN
ncbi:alpha/beta hydrolase [Pseudonocardia kunmingensis]|uniref:Serine aminopeptidase S33 family n=1 Tax=Pseudonocardia kunmingensis TaxID=630975 RepID=A0A543DQ07_9PSEU|nr:alpha/beta hydrolase [Pseudonocardia kunmingensis]TQM11388.1 serine aminopeptidase S33 family [Pseudonocardia kunmingensis]